MVPGHIQLQRKPLVLVQHFARWASYLLPTLLLVACNVPEFGRVPDPVDNEPVPQHASFIRGVELLHSARYQEAISEFNKVVQNDTGDGYAYLGLAEAKVRLERFEEALTDYNKAISLLPEATQVEGYIARGDIHLSLENYAEAWSDFDHLIKVKADYASWWYLRRGMASSGMDDFDKALQDLDQAVQLDPYNSWIYYLRGWVKQDHGCHEAALDDYDKALELASLISEDWYLEIMEQLQAARALATYGFEDSAKCRNL